MAQPKRKSPEKKPAGKTQQRKKTPPLASRMLQSTVAVIGRYPRLIGGALAFGVVFSFVAANALWYQPKHHPAPLLATRMFESDIEKGKAVPKSLEEASADPGVTTFRIERQSDEPALGEVPVDAATAVASPLIRDVQQALARRGLYDGPADGLTGPKTTSAILFFQETAGLEQTGDASVGLLAAIKQQDSTVAVIPDERPSPDVTASTKASAKNSDDVADLIRAAETEPSVRTSKLKTSKAKPTLAESKAEDVSPETVMKIQKALTRFAYAQVKVDGVAGEATKAAIRAFEKNYNLPVTGEPSERIVKKLKAIGAI